MVISMHFFYTWSTLIYMMINIYLFTLYQRWSTWWSAHISLHPINTDLHILWPTSSYTRSTLIYRIIITSLYLIKLLCLITIGQKLINLTKLLINIREKHINLTTYCDQLIILVFYPNFINFTFFPDLLVLMFRREHISVLVVLLSCNGLIARTNLKSRQENHNRNLRRRRLWDVTMTVGLVGISNFYGRGQWHLMTLKWRRVKQWQ